MGHLFLTTFSLLFKSDLMGLFGIRVIVKMRLRMIPKTMRTTTTMTIHVRAMAHLKMGNDMECFEQTDEYFIIGFDPYKPVL